MRARWAIAAMVLLSGWLLGGGTAQASGDCPSGLEQSGLLCYPPCRAGYKGVGPVCWQACPPGFPDHGAFCGKPAPYGRGVGYPWKFGDGLNLDAAKSRCERDHGKGRCEQHGLLIYPKCRTGFHAAGCCICSPNCVDGMRDIGVSCAKKSYGRGVGKPLKSVTEAFDKAGKWIKEQIEKAGKGLKTLGQNVLDGLKKLSASAAKQVLHEPFYLYIVGNRATYLRQARPLTSSEKTALLAHYPRRIVDKVRVLEHPNWTGFFNFGAGATTYGELVIVRRGHRSNSLLKHELVHVCQYDRFGLRGFAHQYADQYVDGGFKYEKIRFEDEAFRFAGGRGYPGMSGPVSAFLKYCSR